MERLDKYRAVGRRAGLLMAVAGCVAALGMMPPLDFGDEEGDAGMGIAVIAMCTIGLGWALGGRFGVRVARGADPFVSGVLVALMTVVGTVLLAVVRLGVDMAAYGQSVAELPRLAIVGLGYVLMFGGMPMVGLGLGYGAMVRKMKGAAVDTAA